MLPGLRCVFCEYLGRRVRLRAHVGLCLHKLMDALTFLIRLPKCEMQINTLVFTEPKLSTT